MALQRHRILKQSAKALAYVAYASNDVRGRAVEVVSSLRAAGIAVDYDILSRALRKQLDDASMKGAAFAVIVAPDEIAAGQVIVRSMKEGTESRHPAGSVADALRKMLRA
jgi:histidyl-tRNA synthetase